MIIEAMRKLEVNMNTSSTKSKFMHMLTILHYVFWLSELLVVVSSVVFGIDISDNRLSLCLIEIILLWFTKRMLFTECELCLKRIRSA